MKWLWANLKNLAGLLVCHADRNGRAILLAGSWKLDTGHDSEGIIEYRQPDGQLGNVSIKARAYLGDIGRKSGAVEP